MAKDGHLWDDSALIKALDNAISKYKIMHGVSGSTAAEKTEENLPAAEDYDGSNGIRSHAEHVQNDDNAALETTAKIGETANHLQVKENSSLESASSAKCVVSSNIQNDNLPPTDENPSAKSGSLGQPMISSDVKSQNEATWYSNGPEEYSQLWNKYYELEDQRQKIIWQLNQYSNWNYQYPISSASTSEEYQASVPQPYDTVTCSCPYGCQNWVFPCNSLPASCSSGTCIDKSCIAIPKGAQNESFVPPKDPDFVKTAMLAAERALSALKKEASSNANMFANGGKDKDSTDVEKDLGQFAEHTKSTTGLDVVLNAWYSAGFYTGNLWKGDKAKAFDPSMLSSSTVDSGRPCLGKSRKYHSIEATESCS